MRTVSGSGTISEDCGFELVYLCGTPTTSTGTGDRWYCGQENGQEVLVHHTNGTPANRCTTTIYTPQEVKKEFVWDWENTRYVPGFEPVKRWCEARL